MTRLTIRNLLKYYIRDDSWPVSNFDKIIILAHRALQRILHGWSVASLKAFRYSLCLHMCIHMCFIFLYITLFFVICVSYVLHMYSYIFYMRSSALQCDTSYLLVYVMQRHMNYWCAYECMNESICFVCTALMLCLYSELNLHSCYWYLHVDSIFFKTQI